MKTANLTTKFIETQFSWWKLEDEVFNQLKELSIEELQEFNPDYDLDIEDREQYSYISGYDDVTFECDGEEETVTPDDLNLYTDEDEREIEPGNYLVKVDFCKGGYCNYEVELEDDEDIDLEVWDSIKMREVKNPLIDNSTFKVIGDLYVYNGVLKYRGKEIIGEDDSVSRSVDYVIYLKTIK